jgi:transcriptional regulator with XRE-family HTH domain
LRFAEDFGDWRKMIMEHQAIREIKEVVLEAIENRYSNGVSLRSIAKDAGLSSATIVRIFNTRYNHNFKISTLLDLSKALSLFSCQPRSTEELIETLRERLIPVLKEAGHYFSHLRSSDKPKEEYALKMMVSKSHFSYTLNTLNTLLNAVEKELEGKITITVEDLGFQK